MYSLRQGRAFLNQEEKINNETNNVQNPSNVYLAQKNERKQKESRSVFNQLNPMQYFKKIMEPFENGNDATPAPVTASSSMASAPASISSTGIADIQKLNDAFDSKMNAYSSAVLEYNKELLKSQDYFVVPVQSLTPINSCFNCDASLGGTDCAAMGVSNSNGDIRTALPDSTSPTTQKPQCQVSGVIVPGWFADPNESGSCIARLGQKCCNFSIYNGEPVCRADFGASNYDENAMNSWVAGCITPPSPEEINQKITLANEYCQGNGISLNYWSQNANKASQSLVLVTTEERVGFRPFAKMNGIPVWMCDLGDPSGVNFFSNYQDANNAKAAIVFSPTTQSTLKSTRDDMMNAGTALISALSSQQTTSAEERTQIEQQLRAVETKMSKLASQSSGLDISLTDAEIVIASKEAFMGTSLLAQETDTRIQFESNYTFYTVWFVIAVVLIVIMFSNFFYTSSSSSSDSGSSSHVLGFGVIVVLIFIYFIIQFVLSRLHISRPQLPFESINPLFVFKSNS